MFMESPQSFLDLLDVHLIAHTVILHMHLEGTKMSIDEILNSIVNYKTRYVCITGGEPLVQPYSRFN